MQGVGAGQAEGKNDLCHRQTIVQAFCFWVLIAIDSDSLSGDALKNKGSLEKKAYNLIDHIYKEGMNLVIFLATNWEMVSAIGQWAGALGTVAAVWVALLQILEMKRQENKKNQQEAKIEFISKNDELEAVLTNTGDAPIYINFPILFHIEEHPVTKEIIRHALSNKQIKSETNKLITRGDVCKMHIPTNLLIEMAEKNKHIYFSIFFAAGGHFTRSFSIVMINDREFELYKAKETIETLNKEEMEILTHIRKLSNSTVSVETNLNIKNLKGKINNLVIGNNKAIDYPINNDPLENTKDPS